MEPGDRPPSVLRELGHEMRNHIGAIRNAAHLVRLRKPADPAILNAAQTIERQIEPMLKLLEQLVGAARVESAPGAGAGPEAAPGAAVAAGASGGRRILLVDDSAAVRDSFSDVLQDMGYEVRTAADGEEALERARDWRPDYAFLDINMPRLDGYEVARRLRAQFTPAEMKLVMISGVTLDAATRRDAALAGFDFCFDKAGPVALLDAWLKGQGGG